MVLGMLVELRKEETVSAMDTVEKSYGCYLGHINSYSLRSRNLINLINLIFLDVDFIATAPHFAKAKLVR